MRESRAVVCCAMAFLALLAFASPAVGQAPPTHPLAQEHPIVFDATALIPPVFWTVPGVTEPLQSVRGRQVSDQVTTLKLKPGRYMYMTTQFAFEFTVNLDGVLDYHQRVEHCVGGRGTAKLVVKCRRMGNIASPD